MDDEQKQLRAADRAARAQGLLDNELLKAAFEEIDRDLIEAWRKEVDPLARDAIWQAVEVNAKVQRILKKHVQNGKVAKVELEKLANVTGMNRTVSVAAA